MCSRLFLLLLLLLLYPNLFSSFTLRLGIGSKTCCCISSSTKQYDAIHLERRDNYLLSERIFDISSSGITSSNLQSNTSFYDKSLAAIKGVFKENFLPKGELSSDYFVYSKWRALQRYISATNHVFGTQALMLALGVTKRKFGTTMATTWILKDILGKICRILWASKFGAKFDAYAKRWRFRSSVLYAVGNCLELLTYLFPALFIFTAALANGLKQIAMLTSSATRNTM